MSKIKATITSRKFWVAVSSAALFALQEMYTEAIACMLGWAVMEGIIDAKRAEQGNAIAGIVLETKTDEPA